MWRAVYGWHYFQSLRAKLDPDFETNAHLKRAGWHNRLRSGLPHGHEDEPDVEDLQDAGALHRATGGGTGRGGQVLPGEKGLGFFSEGESPSGKLVYPPVVCGR